MNAYNGGLEDDGGKVAQMQGAIQRRFQVLLDKSVPHLGHRWAAFGGVVLIYLIRIYFLKGFYIVTYGKDRGAASHGRRLEPSSRVSSAHPT